MVFCHHHQKDKDILYIQKTHNWCNILLKINATARLCTCPFGYLSSMGTTPSGLSPFVGLICFDKWFGCEGIILVLIGSGNWKFDTFWRLISRKTKMNIKKANDVVRNVGKYTSVVLAPLKWTLPFAVTTMKIVTSNVFIYTFSSEIFLFVRHYTMTNAFWRIPLKSLTLIFLIFWISLSLQLSFATSGTAEVMGLNPMVVWKFFFWLLFQNYLKCVNNCNDSSLHHCLHCSII